MSPFEEFKYEPHDAQSVLALVKGGTCEHHNVHRCLMIRQKHGHIVCTSTDVIPSFHNYTDIARKKKQRKFEFKRKYRKKTLKIRITIHFQSL